MEIITTQEMFFRLLVTLLVSFVLGLEREYRHQPAGLRTHILIGIGSCLLMILSILVPEFYNSNINDPGRIAAQVVSGIGFLGAGTIMKMGADTRGLTTAANIWVTAALGMTIGAGFYSIAIIAMIFILFDLIIITKFKHLFLTQKRYCTIDIETKLSKKAAKDIYAVAGKLPLEIISKSIKEGKKSAHVQIISKINRGENIFKIKKAFGKLSDIQHLSIYEGVKS